MMSFRKKRIVYCLASLLICSSCSTSGIYTPVDGEISSWKQKQVVNFLYNYDDISSTIGGREAIGDNLVFSSFEIDEPGLINPPTTNPKRDDYIFTGWYKEKETTNIFDFANEIVSSSLFLYAGWQVDGTGSDEYVEPIYTPPSNIDDSLETDYKVEGILNFPLTGFTVGLPTGGLLRLRNNPNDVRFAVNYKVKSGFDLSKAQYLEEGSTKKILLTFTSFERSEEVEITVNDISSTLVSGPNFEEKAKNYEINSANRDNYEILLAGSSSIEFWKDYERGLSPLKVNAHGLGGSKTSDWVGGLVDRLVTPYSPKLVVYYVGINDLINGTGVVSDVVSGVKQTLTKTHSRLPNTRILYILLNKLPGWYLDRASKIKDIDDQITEYCQSLDYVDVVDAGKCLLKENGLPNEAYFRSDFLHLSEYGYILWGNAIKEKIKEQLTKI